MPAPTMTPEQRAAALEKARVVRAQRSADRQNKLAMGLATPAEVLDQIDDPIIGRMKVKAFVNALPGFGKVKSRGELHGGRWAFRPSVVCRASAPTRWPPSRPPFLSFVRPDGSNQLLDAASPTGTCPCLLFLPRRVPRYARAKGEAIAGTCRALADFRATSAFSPTHNLVGFSLSEVSMPLIYVDTLDDPRLDAFARLTEAQLRSKLEPERALFIAESQKVIELASKAVWSRSRFSWKRSGCPPWRRLSSEWKSARASRPAARGCPVFVAPHDELSGSPASS